MSRIRRWKAKIIHLQKPMDNCGHTHTHTLGVETPQKHEQLKLITDDETKKVKLQDAKRKQLAK